MTSPSEHNEPKTKLVGHHDIIQVTNLHCVNTVLFRQSAFFSNNKLNKHANNRQSDRGNIIYYIYTYTQSLLGQRDRSTNADMKTAASLTSRFNN
jgi:hypothetical protein